MRLSVTAGTLRARVAAFRSGVAPMAGNQVDLTRSTFDPVLARQLYADLLAPLQALIGRRTRLTIAPDAPLHVLPFDALVIGGSWSAPTFALDRYTIDFITTAGAASGKREKSYARTRITAVAAPESDADITGTRKEVRAIRDAVTGRTTVVTLSGAAATERAVRAAARLGGVLHFATHARANEVDPDRSLIALAPGDGDDGRLHAYEIRLLGLANSLVVLSACATGTGRLVTGEGPLSLGRAFLQSGASAVVVSLWPVGPSAPELMAPFYRRLLDGVPVSRALHEAKLELRNGRLSHPFYWAAFTVVE